MSHDSLSSKINRISEMIVLLEPTDRSCLSEIQMRLMQIARMLREEGLSEPAGYAEQAEKEIGQLITDNPGGRAGAVDHIGSIIQRMQTAFLSRRAPVEKPSPMMEDTDDENREIFESFVSETRDHLDAIDTNLLILEKEPHHCESLHAAFRAFHTIKGSSALLHLNDMSTLAHKAESMLSLVKEGKRELTGDTFQLIFEIVDSLKKLLLETIESGVGRTSLAHPAFSQPLQTKSPASIEKMSGSTENMIVSGTTAATTAAANGGSPDAVVFRHSSIRDRPGRKLPQVASYQEDLPGKPLTLPDEKRPNPQGSPLPETIRVDRGRLDSLVEMIGTLAVAQTMLSEILEKELRMPEKIYRQLMQVNKITRELQALGLTLRMIPLRPTFQRMTRLVRDLVQKSGKPIEFTVRGEDSLLDKKIVDAISDPLMHLLRNAVDHGIEATTQERIRAGKPETGRIELVAHHAQGSIHIHIKDDGRGLDRDAILSKAREIGVCNENEIPSDERIFHFIFLPGMSTANEVTELSGRGVGLDVVQKVVHSLNGQVEVHSTPGEGCLFTIRLPLTMAMIEGLLVRVGNERYIIPTNAVIRSVRPKPDEILTVANKEELLGLNDKWIPLYRMRTLFGIESDESGSETPVVVILQDHGQQAGMVIDEIIGNHEVVIKSLGKSFQNIDGISAGAILADGQVVLIFDVGSLLKMKKKYTTQNIII